jgi:hypothetical protein
MRLVVLEGEKKAYMANEIARMQIIKIFKIWSLILTHNFLILPVRCYHHKLLDFHKKNGANEMSFRI